MFTFPDRYCKRFVTKPLILDAKTCVKVVNDKLTLKYLENGEIGLVDFFLDRLIRDEFIDDVHIVCCSMTGKVKGALKYMNIDGTMVSDVGGTSLLYRLNKNMMPSITSRFPQYKFKLTNKFISHLIDRIFVPNDGSINPWRASLVDMVTRADTLETKETKDGKIARKTLTKKDRTDVWNFYIGAGFGTHKCLLCTFKTIDKGLGDWHCAHVVPHSIGGKTILSNLRPICADCNLSMGDTPMIAYCLHRENTDAIARLQLTGELVENKTTISS